MAEKYNNATTLFDNPVTESSSGKGGVTSKLKNSLTSSVNNIKQNPKIGQLNKLKSGIKSVNSAEFKAKALATAKGTLNAFGTAAKSMAKSMVKDSITSLKNAGKNFIKNTVNQIMEDIKASVYIPDKIFCATIKPMYYAGADLAYMDHYIRNSALTKDWDITLKFLDSQYDIDYSTEYNKLDSDLSKAASNGCFKNIEYMFGRILKHRNSTNAQITSLETSIATTIDEQRKSDLTKALTELKSNLKKYDRILNLYTKMLITYGYSSLKASEVKKIIKMTNGIVLPKYFGTTDDKYNKAYNFTASDCKVMLPTFKQSDEELTSADKDTLSDVSSQVDEKNKQVDALKQSAQTNANISSALKTATDNLYLTSEETKQFTQAQAYTKTASKLQNFQANYESKNTSRTGALSTTAIKKGSKATFTDIRSRYHKNRDGVQVKYRKSVTSYLESGLEDQTEEEYVTLRNGNIKSIYVLLTNRSIYGNNVMVNENFYKRCKLPVKSGLVKSADKVKGLLGASSVVQSIYDLQDLVDSSVYKYTKKVEDRLYNPQRKESILTGGPSTALGLNKETGDIILPMISDAGTVVNTTNIEEAIKNPESFQPTNSGTTVSNDASLEEINNKLDNNLEAKKSVSGYTRYLSKLQLYVKRDILIKYLSWFYNSIIDYGISEKISGKCLSNLVYNIFGRTGFNNPNMLDDLFTYSDNDSLNNNIIAYISVSKLKLHNDYMSLDSYDSNIKANVTKIYDLSVYILEMEIKSTSFAKAVFNYDNDYIRTLVKQKYEADLKHLKELKTATSMDDFWIQKDTMTKNYDGFDRFGIFGFDERTNFRVKYTNVETGDWNSICVGTEGTFFGGSDNTSNNGVRYLDDSSDEIYPTSITSGTWKIFEKLSTMLFLNDKGKLYTWNSNRKDLDKILDNADKYEIIDIPRYNLIFLLGKSNNGIKILNNKSITTILESGDNFKYIINKNKIFFFSETSSTNVIAFDINEKTFNSIGVIGPVTTPIFFTVKKTVTATSPSTGTQTGNNASQQTSTTNIEYSHHILFGTQNDAGILDVVNTSTSASSYISNTYSTYERSTINKGNYHLFKTSDTEVYAIRDNSETAIGYKYELTLEQSYSIVTGQAVSYTPDYTISSYNIHYNATNFSYINDYLFFSSTNSNKTDKIRNFYVHNPDDNRLYTINPEDMLTTRFSNIYNRNSTLIIGVDSINRVYGYDYKTHTLNIILNNEKYKDYNYGWEYGYINSNYGYLFNNKVDDGLILYDNNNNKRISNNLTSGYWKCLEGRNYYYALSQNGTDSGVKQSNKGNFNFVNITEQIVNHYDIPGFAYDSSRYKTYTGTERSKDSLDVDNIKYDIDEFVYLQNSYQLYKLIESTDSDKTTNLMNNITKKFKKASSGEGSSSGSSSSGEDLFDLDSFISEIHDKYDSYKESLNEIEIESPLYTDLISTISANEEFDVDDEEAKNSIIADLIIGDEGKNSKAYMLVDDEVNTKFVIKTYDEKYKDLVPGTRNYNLINDYATSDFLNSDEDDITGVPISS